MSPNPGPSWKAIGTGDFNGDGISDILWQNTSTGQAAIWEMNGTTDRRRGGEPQSRAELESGRNGRFQPRRPFRHPVAEHGHRPGRDLGYGREHLIGGGVVSPNPGPSLACDRIGRFLRRRPFRHPVPERQHGPGRDLGDGRDHPTGGGVVSPNPGASWHAIGTGAGGSDILFQNTSGQSAIWEMDGNTRTRRRGGRPPIPDRPGMRSG